LQAVLVGDEKLWEAGYIMIDVASLEMCLVCKEMLEFQKSTYKQPCLKSFLKPDWPLHRIAQCACAFGDAREGRISIWIKTDINSSKHSGNYMYHSI
jgi:hypothetical protein